MGNQLWLEELHRQLIGRNLPRSYVKRFLEEISDHLADLKEENMEVEANARLGEAKHVANAAVSAYRNRSLLGRHPVAAFVTFALSPVVLLGFLSIVGLLVFGLCGKWLGFIDDSKGIEFGAMGNALLPYLLPIAVNVVPAMILTLFYCGLARRSGVSRKWAVVSCVILAVTTAMTYCKLTFFGTSGHGCMTFGLGACNVMQIGQFLVALALTCWLMRRFDQKQPHYKISLLSSGKWA